MVVTVFFLECVEKEQKIYRDREGNCRLPMGTMVDDDDDVVR